MGVHLTARDQELIIAAFQCLETEPKINYARFAEMSNLKVSSAMSAWSVLKKKLVGGSAAVPPTAKHVPVKKRKDANELPKPSNKRAKPGMTGSASDQEDEDDDDEDDDEFSGATRHYNSSQGPLAVKQEPAGDHDDIPKGNGVKTEEV